MSKNKRKHQQEQESTTKEIFETVNQSAYKSERFFQQNAKVISILFGSILAIVLAYFAYVKFYEHPRNEEANIDLYHAKKSLLNDSLDLALEGESGGYLGFNGIADKYSGTNAAELSNYYAAVTNYKKGEYATALKLLDKVEPQDEILAAMKLGIQGDCLSQVESYEEAIKKYVAAADVRDNNFTTPTFLKKAGDLALSLGKNDQALGMYQKIKDKYKDSAAARDIDKYIERAKAK